MRTLKVGPDEDQDRNNDIHQEFTGRNKYRYHPDHRYRTNWSRAGFIRFCEMPVVPAQVFAGRRPAKSWAGTTGIAQNLKNKRCRTK